MIKKKGTVSSAYGTLLDSLIGDALTKKKGVLGLHFVYRRGFLVF
jgi:hypothetical protein